MNASAPALSPAAPADTATGGAEEIRLEGVSKVYADGTVGVAELDLTFAAGELSVLVGPSGCGKTTTMKMINRLIEPSTGRILLGDDDVTRVDPVKLRRRIGYVIQNVGLFPHQTIAQNIATVPRLLGWDKGRINERVDELLETVSMDPASYRDRYPKELSGGQRQRVGVARAMSVVVNTFALPRCVAARDPLGSLLVARLACTCSKPSNRIQTSDYSLYQLCSNQDTDRILPHCTCHSGNVGHVGCLTLSNGRMRLPVPPMLRPL